MNTTERTAVNIDERRKHPRLFKRLTTKFIVDCESYRCISTDLSERGLFLRTNRVFTVNSPIDIEILLPDNKICFLKGIVRRSVRTPIPSMENGMGIEIIEKDETFIDFVRSIIREREENEVEKNMHERRRHKRFNVEDMNFNSEMPSANDVKIINISSMGIMVKVDRILNIGNKHALKIEYKDKVLFVKAAVVWTLLIDNLEDANGNMIPIHIAGMQITDVLKGEIKEIISLLEKAKK